MKHRPHYDHDPLAFSAEAYSVRQYPGIAFNVLGWETVPTEDTEGDGFEKRTGRVLAVMIGDDYKHSLDESDLTPIEREAYCGQCGQIGCSHDGLYRCDDYKHSLDESDLTPIEREV